MAPDLNPTAASLLGFLQLGPMTGWDLDAMVRSSIGNFWNVTRSQIYRELRTLTERGYVTAGDAGRRDRVPYTITAAGQEAFASWIAQDPPGDVIRSRLLLTVFFGGHVDGRRMERFLAVHRLRHEERLEHYRELAAALAGAEGMAWAVHALRYGIEHEEAVLRWFAGFSKPAGAGPGSDRDGRRLRRAR